MNRLSSSGFSLVELMIGGAILAGIGLTGATLMKNSKKAQSRVDHDLELDLFHATISDMFTSNAKDCDATFRSKYNSSDLSAITEIRKCTAGCDATKDASSVTSHSPVYKVGAAANVVNPGRERNLWYIESFGRLSYFDNATSTFIETNPRTNIYRLPVNYKHRTQSNRVVTKYVLIGMRFDTSGRFQQCIDGQTTLIQNLSKEMCEAIKIDDGSGTYRGRWNGQTQKCESTMVSGGDGLPCPVGQGWIGNPDPTSGVQPCKSHTSLMDVPVYAQPYPTTGAPGGQGMRSWSFLFEVPKCENTPTYTMSSMKLQAGDGNTVRIICW